jgi:hypothetical protein
MRRTPMKPRWLGRRLLGVLFTACAVLSSVLATSALVAGPAGADPYAKAEVGIDGAGKAFDAGAKVLKAFNAFPGGEQVALGINLLSTILGPLFGLGITEGPTIQDVLDKLDQMTEQLNQIQTQLNQIDAKISQLQIQLAGLSKQIANASCNGLLADLNPYIDTITGVSHLYGTTLTTAEGLPTSPDPTATLATTKADYTNLVTAALGKNANTPVGGPLDKAIAGIHRSLVGEGGNADNGVIHTCAKAGLLNFQAGKATTHWVDDRSYYAYVTALVNYYENYEVLALSLVQEATYYQVTQRLADAHVIISPEQTKSACALKQADAGDPLQLCRDSATLTDDVYQDLVDEWTLTGRPYSDDKTVLQVGSATSAQPGNIKPILWVRDPKAVPAAMATGTWKTDPNKTGTYDNLSGWKPAGLAEWTSLLTSSIQTNDGSCPGSVHSPNDLFDCMSSSGQFAHVSGIFWLPQQKASGLKLPAPTTISVLGNGGNRYAFEFGGPDLTLRCFVDATPSQYSPIACGQDWISRHGAVTKQTAESEHTSEATYTIQWGFNVTGLTLPPTTFGYYYIEPYAQTAPGYAFDDKTQAYPAPINTAVTGALPFFLEPIKISVLKTCNGFFSTEYMCDDSDKTYAPQATPEGLWQTLAVPTTQSSTQQCVNTVGVPQLCAPVNGAKPTAEDQSFEAWINNTIPNPSLPAPEAKDRPTITAAGTGAQCNSLGWKAAPANWTYGPVRAQPTTWTATDGTKSYTSPTGSGTPAGNGDTLDLKAFATAAGFDAGTPFQLTCTVNARWEGLVNSGSASSATYQVTPKGATFVLTQVPDAPSIGAAVAGDKSATVHWTVGANHGTPISSFTVTPYLKGVAQAPLPALAAGGPDLSAAEGSKDSTVIKDLTPGTAYTFTVTANATAAGTTTLVPSPPSSQSKAVTPIEVGPKPAPLTEPTTTTTVPPLKPIGPPVTIPTTTTTTTAPPSTGYTQSMTKVSASEALADFVPAAPINLVDVRYRINGVEQDFRMVLQNGHYQKTLVGLAKGDVVTYWFYYEPAQTGAQPITTPDYTYTQG